MVTYTKPQQRDSPFNCPSYICTSMSCCTRKCFFCPEVCTLLQTDPEQLNVLGPLQECGHGEYLI